MVLFINNKASISSTHKTKYPKTSRGVKRSNNSSSRNFDQPSWQGSNSSKFSPVTYGSRGGIDKNSLNTKSYNSLMTMLMNKDQDIFRTSMNLKSSNHVKSTSNTPSSNSKHTNSSRVRHVELENSHKKSTDPQIIQKPNINFYAHKQSRNQLKNDFQEYLKSSRNSSGKNHYLPYI